MGSLQEMHNELVLHIDSRNYLNDSVNEKFKPDYTDSCSVYFDIYDVLFQITRCDE